MAVFIFPFENQSNKYLDNIKSIISEECVVQKFPGPRSILKLFFTKGKDILILNWVEDLASESHALRFVFWCFYLLFARIFFRKVVWIRHNFMPHRHNNLRKYKFMCCFLSLISNLKLTHRPIDGYDYLPHPTYKNNLADALSNPRDIEFLYFGVIKEYKGIPDLLNMWPGDKKLYLRGRCDDERLNAEILSIIEKRNLTVDYINEFLSEQKLDVLLARTQVVVLPHLDKRMIVSGAFYHAASCGCNVLLRKGEFYNYLIDKFSFVHQIGATWGELIEPEKVIKSIELECGKGSIKRKLIAFNILK